MLQKSALGAVKSHFATGEKSVTGAELDMAG